MGSETVLDALAAALGTRGRYGPSELAPVALLWPDEAGQWQPIIPLLRAQRLVIELGDYEPDAFRGPAYWIKAVLDGDVALPGRADTSVPIVYLPHYARSDIRAVEEADVRLKPLAELQYRGTIFAQQNGRDWTLAAFLQSKQGGLGLEVADDQATRDAMLRAGLELAGQSVDELRKRAPLKASFFDGLLAPDLDREVLRWLDNPAAFREALTREEWDAFRFQFADLFGIGLDEGEIIVAGELGRRHGAWAIVWQRYADAPDRYPSVEQRLRDAAPKRLREDPGLFDGPLGSWPQDNEAGEGRLRRGFGEVASMDPAAGADRILTLEREHGERRDWVWASVGEAPLAMASRHLSELVANTRHLLPSAAVATIVDAYVNGAWRADDSVMRALGAVTSKADRDEVIGVIRAIYAPWLDESARRFQQAVGDTATDYVVEPLDDWPKGTCLVFIDGLRFDVAKRVEGALRAAGLEVTLRPRLTALPTITATAKPAAAPIASRLGPGNGLGPAPKDGGADLNVIGLRSLLASGGYQVLMEGETGDPTGRAWTEHGDIDELGHKQAAKLPSLLDSEAQSLGERVIGLLAADWRQVVVVTDHGWLYLPGDLPKVELPLFLTKDERMRKGRTGRLAEGAVAPAGTVPWFWDPSVRMAVAPGIATFIAGCVYEHGGVSPQECITPVITVRPAAASRGPIAVSIAWRGLRADVTASGATARARVDLRRKAGDGATSLLASPSLVSEEGVARILVRQDDDIDTPAFLVVLDDDDRLIAQEMVTVGGGG